MPAPKKYPKELRERAVRLVFQIRRERATSHGVIPEVARRLGIGDQSLRLWVKQADIDEGNRSGTTSADAARIAELERENRELRRSNEILKAASAFMPSWGLCRLLVVLVGVVAGQLGWQSARRSA
jgi:transposase